MKPEKYSYNTIRFETIRDDFRIPPPETEEEYQRLLEEIAYLGEVYDTVKEV